MNLQPLRGCGMDFCLLHMASGGGLDARCRRKGEFITW
jgi:hypothetical protein